MEKIRQAVERARAGRISSKSQVLEDFDLPRQHTDFSAIARNTARPQVQETEIDPNYLQSGRIVTYNGADQRSRPYDMLRTQVLRSMGMKGWKILGVTSPTPGCGKTLTAVNLAFSIARQPDQSVVLVDLDLQKPRVANSLGLNSAERGALDLLHQRTTLRNMLIRVRAGDHRIAVLPTAATKESSELMGSRAMSNLLEDLRTDYQTVIVDLPPILSSDDVISILPQIDCVLLVVAVGLSKAAEVEECIRHLQSSQLVRLVVNKAPDAAPNYHY